MPMDRRIILVAGPTASGKSALALALAEHFGGVVVNADSMQVYRDLRILTARPSLQDEARVPHRLYGHVDAADPYSAGRYIEDVERLLAAEPEKHLIFVGGTGLYLRALTNGIAPMPKVPDEVRARVRELALTHRPDELHGLLAEIDPASAALLRPSDPQRILRALEVHAATGRSIRDWQQAPARPVIANARGFVLAPDRAELRARIAERFGRMMEEGALEEAVALHARGLDPSLPAMRALGAAALAALNRGEIGREEAEAQIVTETRQYAKRQETWFRNQMRDWRKVTPDHAFAVISASIAE